MARLYRCENELLKALDRPKTPLHTNESENDLRTLVTKRKISAGMMSRDGLWALVVQQVACSRGLLLVSSSA